MSTLKFVERLSFGSWLSSINHALHDKKIELPQKRLAEEKIGYVT